MTDEALLITPACLHPTAWLFEISIEQFEKTYQEHSYSTTYTATIRLDTHHVQKYFGVPASFWKLSIVTSYGSSNATYQIGPTCAKHLLASKESLRVECAVSGSGLHFGDTYDVVIGPEGWAPQSDTTKRNLSIPSEQRKANDEYWQIIRPGSVVYMRLAFYATDTSGGSLGSCRNHLAQKFGTLLDSGRVTDCTVVSRDGKQFAVHRAVLAAQSPVFAAMFENNCIAKSSGNCTINDINGVVLEALVKFAYTCAPLELPADLLPDLYDAAEKYDMDDLRSHCESVMTGAINVDIALRYLLFAKERGLKKLKTQAIKFLYDHSSEI
ncbi:uncharacterized protein LOC129593062 isoform X1 [Paramacrobiotus metropolitanus]|uniref:uncharacterized protein LOC129593062 isoform X1 n=1 Tax=Paramacrobiotus metropolitanus TaxID=2943436 RepID=UPI0024460F62|nr:uncharacterized protein LOC129593062 isoform X1 [Paramacrobiotus metropolitanus]